MKYFYAFCLLAFCTLCTTSCTGYKHAITFFAGDKPIYGIGTCTNQVFSVDLYPIVPEGIVVGIDGGDGDYSIFMNRNEKVVSAELFTSGEYKRLRLIPKQIGKSEIMILDGDGMPGTLVVEVSEYGRQLSVTHRYVLVKGTVTDEKKAEITKAVMATFPVGAGGYFQLVSKHYPEWNKEGTLFIYKSSGEQTPAEGTYEWKQILVDGKEKMGFSFKFDYKEYQFALSIDEPEVRNMGNPLVPLYEDVTSECPVECPAGVKVYRAYQLSVANL